MFSLLVGLWEMIFKIGVLLSWLKSSRASEFLSKIGTKSNGWTLCKVLRGGGGGRPLRKKLEIEIFRLLEMHWNCQSYHHHVILYHFKSLTIQSGGPDSILIYMLKSLKIFKNIQHEPKIKRSYKSECKPEYLQTYDCV